MHESYLKAEFCLGDSEINQLKTNISRIFKEFMEYNINNAIHRQLTERYGIEISENQRKYIKYLSDGLSEEVLEMFKLDKKAADIYIKDMAKRIDEEILKQKEQKR